jgi:hypothetical protein
MTYIGYFGTALMIVAGFCGLNEILFAVSSEFGMPTTIGGLGWALDHAVLGSPVFQALGTAAGFVLSFLYDPNNETGAKFRTDRAKVVALEKMERIGDGARVTVGSPARDRASKRRVRISAPKAAPAIRQNDADEKVPA